MALLNTHTDYMRFDGKEACAECYPVEYYLEFLEYINTNYKDLCWHVLPEEIARFWKKNLIEKAQGAGRRGLEAGKLEGKKA
jgi:hypothetical protein